MRQMIKAFNNQSEKTLQKVSNILPNCQHKETCNVIVQLLMLSQLYVKQNDQVLLKNHQFFKLFERYLGCYFI